MENAFDTLEIGHQITGEKFTPTRETIREFCDASLDHNPLHLDDNYMKNKFGKTDFGGIIMHGMSNFSLMSKMLTDWLLPRGGVHRRLETRWLIPVKPGDTIQPTARLSFKKQTKNTNWVGFEIQMRNQRGDLVARADAMAEFPNQATQAPEK